MTGNELVPPVDDIEYFRVLRGDDCAYRMKKQGKSWSVSGADNLIHLLSKEWNGEGLEHIIEEGLSAWKAACLPQKILALRVLF